MPALPKEHVDQRDELIAAYRRAWFRILAEQQKLIDDPRAFRRRSRLLELQRAVEAHLAGLDELAQAWTAAQIPSIYGGSAQTAAQESVREGASVTYSFTAHDLEAVDVLTSGLFQDLLKSTKFVRRSVKTLIREIAKDEALQAVIVGQPVKTAAREMRRFLESTGIHSVVYKDGTKVGMGQYAEMAIRTTTAIAYNRGSLSGAAAAVVEVWEIFDGPTCGLTYHDDPLLANGLIVPRDVAEAFPISHPNCVRAIAPRPDLTLANVSESLGRDTAELESAQKAASRRDSARARAVSRREGPTSARGMALAARESVLKAHN